MQRVSATSMPPAAGIYRHFKGRRYRVLGTAQHSETLETLVVYQALYGDHGWWVRPASMFNATVELDGKAVPRFALEHPDSHQALTDAASA